MVGPVTSKYSTKPDSHLPSHRLQLLAQAIEKVESESSQKQAQLVSSAAKQQVEQISTDSLPMVSTQQQDMLMKLFSQQNMATVMAAAAAQIQAHQQQKPEPISPPSTSSASSSAESPIDFSSRRSTDENPDCSAPSSPLANQQQQLLANMLQNLQSTPSNSQFPFLLASKNGKPTRPFKAYPRDPLLLPLGFCSSTGNTGNTTSIEQTNLLAEVISRSTTNRKRLAQTQERLKQRLQQQQQSYFISSTGAQILQPPKKRHRTITNEEHSPIDDHSHSISGNLTINSSLTASLTSKNDDSLNTIKDDAYWERRRKNNEAAKRSRDARRAKEDEIALRAAILEQENIKLRLEVSQLKQETAKLRCMVYTPS